MVKNLEKPDPVCAKRPYIPVLTSNYCQFLAPSSLAPKFVNECSKDFMNHPEKNHQNIFYDFPGQTSCHVNEVCIALFLSQCKPVLNQFENCSLLLYCYFVNPLKEGRKKKTGI